MKTKICNNKYGHLKSCDLNYQNDYRLGHLIWWLERITFGYKTWYVIEKLLSRGIRLFVNFLIWLQDEMLWTHEIVGFITW
jgi:hypothetical protein